MSYRYLIYHLRWQISALVMIFPMYFFQSSLSLPIWGSLMASQFVGALIFYWIDRRIFESKDRNNEYQNLKMEIE